MASSNLKLIMQKGPRNGETLEFNPRSTIRIGRLVRGNNLPIKDSGISSKHLEIKFHSDSSNWQITDLDSSNGTIVNSSQLIPFEQFEICHGDEIKIGELTLIRVEIGEESRARRNPRRQFVSKSVSDLKGKVEDGLNLGEKAEIREEIDNHKNPRRQVVSRSVNDLKGKVGEGLKLGENAEIREEFDNVKNHKRGAASKVGTELGGKVEEGSNLGENVEINSRRNPKKQAAAKKGHELRSKREVPEEACSNLAEESSSMFRESKEENVVKGVEDDRRGRGRGRTKKVSNNVGVGEDEGNVKLKPEGGVGTRRTRSTRRGEVELVSLDDVMPTRRTRSAKNVEDVMASSLMEKVVESKGSGTDDCIEAENIGMVEKKKTRGGRGRKKKVAESLENIQEAVAEEKINHEVLEKECSEKVVDSREQPCDEPANDAPEKSLHDDAKNEQFMEVAVPELEQDALSVKEKHCAELMDEFCHVSAESLENDCGAVAVVKLNHEFLQNEISEKSVYVSEQPCDEPIDDPPEHSVCDEPVNYLPGKSVCEPVNDLTEQSVCNEPVNNPPEQSVLDETKIGQLMEVEVPEQEGGALSMSEKPRAELMDETNQWDNCVSLPVGEQHCTELMDETNQQDECVSLPVKEKHCVGLMVEPTQHDDCDVGPSHVEEGVCDGLGSDVVFDDRKTEELEIEEIDKESETKCYGRNNGPESTDMPDLEKMTLGDWFTFLETYFPKQIRATTDEIIEDMQKRSAQFDEYVLQHQKEKNKLPLATEKERT